MSDRTLKKPAIDFGVLEPPFDTTALRSALAVFLNQTFEFQSPRGHLKRRLGGIKWGIYAFYDYEREPIYVGQTRESLGTRIRRHLTNQRTDAAAMNVLDPFEVCYIRVWPLPGYEDIPAAEAAKSLNDLEFAIYERSIQESKFKAILNEKDPRPPSGDRPDIPQFVEGKVTSPEVENLRAHPDLRIARRALVLARLAQVVSERAVRLGLRRALKTQATRLSWLANARYDALVKAGVKMEVEGDSNDADEEPT